MSAVLWMNIPLMVLAFGLMAGIPLWLVLRRHDWHGKHGNPQPCRPTWRAAPASLSGPPRCVFPGRPGTRVAAPMRPADRRRERLIQPGKRIGQGLITARPAVSSVNRAP